MTMYRVFKDPFGDWTIEQSTSGPFTRDEAIAARNAVNRVDRYAPRYEAKGPHVDDRTGVGARIYARTPEMAQRIADYLNSVEPEKPLRYDVMIGEYCDTAYDNQIGQRMTPLECCDVMNAYQDEVMS